ncbi:polysaccharide pyruvyl transferase family protein [Butyrivibrio sp.]|uniref:polysaccharide pyruvyl transferase family protein n=1 Tax=Butyrivibrio sp. TaxID=28121 RepID=UPI0025BCD02A|nr:polysaccharide pyruvyl transferase family protein [Butyrivibrio sp.]MBE5838866.1 polysaccharide pyruvyl transferase family protein [Butyrivibrio sp.]
MKKVGIITFHHTTNFGSFLQTLALYENIKSLGYDVEIIDYRSEAIQKRETPDKKPASLNPKDILKFILFTPIIAKKYRNLMDSVNSCLRLSDTYTVNTINNIKEKYDVYVVGSDILWDVELTNGDKTYFLDFVKDGKKIAFATSVGKKWEEQTAKDLKKYLCDFEHIAVRERESAIWISELLGINIDNVCDPTMLIEEKYWSGYADKSQFETGSREYILVYFPDNNMVEDAKEYARKNNLDVLVINYRLPRRNVKNIRVYRVEDFLWLIKKSKMVFTSSYHGVLFSIYFHVPFYIYYRNNSHNVRFDALVSKFNIGNRIRRLSEEMDDNVDFCSIDDAMSMWRAESLELLRTYLES